MEKQEKFIKTDLTSAKLCVIIYLYLLKGVDEEGNVAEPQREVAVGASHRGLALFVASEPGGRKRTQVDPPRDCCVNAYGLSDPEGRLLCRNLSGTAGKLLVSRILYSLGRLFFCLRTGGFYGKHDGHRSQNQRNGRAYP